MKNIKSITEIAVAIKGGQSKEYRMQSLKHAGTDILDGDNISIFQQDWFENLLPDTMSIVSDPGIFRLNYDQSLTPQQRRQYIFDKNECTIGSDLVQFTYWYNPYLNPGDELKDGEPSSVEFDIHFVKNDNGIKLIVDITYGDHKAVEFSIEAPNKINVIHYTGIGSKYDDKTHWGFTDRTIKDLINFFNAFNHGIKLETKDLAFIDEHPDSYQHNIDDNRHLYTDDSLIKFGNASEQKFIRKYIKLYEDFFKLQS